MATVADVIVDQLRDAGVTTLFGVPGGGGNLDLIAAAGRAGLGFVLTTSETGAAIAALAQAEVTGRPGVCLTTLGPGASSVMNGVACAFLDRAPVIVFTDSAAPTFEHQRLNQPALFDSITNGSYRLSPDNVSKVMGEALARAQSPRPGPVHVECPSGVCASEVHTDVGWGKKTSGVFSDGTHREKTPDVFFPNLGTRKPLLLVGLGSRRPDDAAAIRALCERRRLPAMVTYKAKGVVADGDQWFAGVFTNAAIERPLLDDADLLIGLGLDPVELLPRDWNHRPPIVFAGPWRVEDTHVPFAAQMIGPVSQCAAFLESQLPVSSWTSAEFEAVVDAQRQAVSIPGDALTAGMVVQRVANRFAPVSRVTVDAGAHMFPATTLWPVSNPNDILISNGLSTMGFALPAAIGAATADPARPVVALTGDGGLLMCAGELLTAVRENLRIIIVVFRDSSLSLIEIKQQARRLRPAGVALGDVDWTTLARSFGAPSASARTEEELDQALEFASSCEGPCLIEATIDRSNYGSTMRAIRG